MWNRNSWLLLPSGTPSIRSGGCGKRSVLRRGGWNSPTLLKGLEDKTGAMRKAGEGRAQGGLGCRRRWRQAALVSHLTWDIWRSLGEVTPVPSCFHPSLWHLLVGCKILSPTFPLQQAPSQPALCSPERTGHAPPLQNHFLAAHDPK